MNVSKKLKRKMNRIVKDRFVSEYHCINMRDGIYTQTIHKRIFDRLYGNIRL
jgi:hypothetical protein